MPEQDEAVEFAAALARRDIGTAARLASSISYGVEVIDDLPGTGVIDGRRVLPAFVTFESWQRFGSTNEIRLLAPAAFATVLANSRVDEVLFEPSLETATQIPVADVLSLLRGEARDAQGEPVLVGDLQVVPFPALLARIHEVAGPQPTERAVDAWALCRVTAGGSVPLLATAHDTTDDQVATLVARLSDHELPRELEVIRLSEGDTEIARSQWSAVQL